MTLSSGARSARVGQAAGNDGSAGRGIHPRSLPSPFAYQSAVPAALSSDSVLHRRCSDEAEDGAKGWNFLARRSRK